MCGYLLLVKRNNGNRNALSFAMTAWHSRTIFQEACAVTHLAMARHKAVFRRSIDDE